MHKNVKRVHMKEKEYANVFICGILSNMFQCDFPNINFPYFLLDVTIEINSRRST